VLKVVIKKIKVNSLATTVYINFLLKLFRGCQLLLS